MAGAVDTPNASDRISPCILRVSVTDRIEIGTASADLIGKVK